MLTGPDRQCASKRGRNKIALGSKILQFGFSDWDVDCPLCMAVNVAVLSLAILHSRGNANLMEQIWPVLSIRYVSFICEFWWFTLLFWSLEGSVSVMEKWLSKGYSEFNVSRYKLQGLQRTQCVQIQTARFWLCHSSLRICVVTCRVPLPFCQLAVG